MLLASENIAPTRRIELLGMSLDALTGDQLIDHLLEELTDARGGWLLTANLDKMQRFARDRGADRCAPE